MPKGRNICHAPCGHCPLDHQHSLLSLLNGGKVTVKASKGQQYAGKPKGCNRECVGKPKGSNREITGKAEGQQQGQKAARACLKGGIFALGHEGGFLHVSNLPQLGSILTALPLQLLLLAS